MNEPSKEEFYDALFDFMMNILKDSGNILEANRKAKKLTEFKTRDELIEIVMGKSETSE